MMCQMTGQKSSKLAEPATNSAKPVEGITSVNGLPNLTSLRSETPLKALADRVRVLRAQHGMTRRQLAQQSGVSLPHLARLEGRSRNVSLLVLDRLAQALNVSLGNLLSFDGTADGDLAVITEFLRRQQPEALASIRHQLFSQFDMRSKPPTARIALIGLRGAGKSTVGPLLARQLKVPFLELNAAIEREAGVGVQEIFNLYGQSGYRNLERRCLENIVAVHPQLVLATGGGIVADSASLKALLQSFYTIWLRAEPMLHFQRVKAQADSRIATPALYREAMDNIRRTLDARNGLYSLAKFHFDTSCSTPDQVLAALLVHINSVSKSSLR